MCCTLLDITEMTRGIILTVGGDEGTAAGEPLKSYQQGQKPSPVCTGWDRKKADDGSFRMVPLSCAASPFSVQQQRANRALQTRVQKPGRESSTRSFEELTCQENLDEKPYN